MLGESDDDCACTMAQWCLPMARQQAGSGEASADANTGAMVTSTSIRSAAAAVALRILSYNGGREFVRSQFGCEEEREGLQTQETIAGARGGDLRREFLMQL